MTACTQGIEVDVRLLGRFEVTVGDRTVGGSAWPSRRAAELVQLLALTENHAVARDEVIEALWPHLEPTAAASNLRKAAHFARRALDSADAVVLRQDRVELFPDRTVRTDLAQLLVDADAALRDADRVAAATVSNSYSGELLPESRYEEWTQAARRHLSARRADLLRVAGC